MTLDLVLRLVMGVGIVVLYVSNFWTGLQATQLARRNLPPVRERWHVLWWLCQSMFRPCVLRRLTPTQGRHLVLAVNCYGTYLSSFVAGGMALTHIVWLNSGFWREQDHLFAFATFHWLAAAFVHAVHTRLVVQLSILEPDNDA